jgi:hypothetical protein
MVRTDIKRKCSGVAAALGMPRYAALSLGTLKCALTVGISDRFPSRPLVNDTATSTVSTRVSFRLAHIQDTHDSTQRSRMSTRCA